MKFFYFLVVLFLGLWLAGCGTETPTSDDGPDEGGGGPIFDTTPPVLMNLGISIEGYTTSCATGNIVGCFGDFSYRDDYMSYDPLLLEFGRVSGHILPTLEYRADVNAVIISPVDGYVHYVEYKADTDDNELFIKINSNSVYNIVVDHVKNLQVSQGDTITAGQALGTPGTISFPGLGRLEIMVTRSDEKTYHCPISLLSDTVKDTYRNKITTFMSEWETLRAVQPWGSCAAPECYDPYDQAAMVEPGCVKEKYCEEVGTGFAIECSG